MAMRELPPIRKDPFHRVRLAQSRCESLTLVTRARVLGDYDVPMLGA